MSNEKEARPRGDIAGFASFFRSYMSVSTVVAAAAPIPIAGFKAIPMYAVQRGFLTVYSSMFSFLLLALIFSLRHLIARLMLRSGQRLWISVMAFLAIILCAVCVVSYHAALRESLDLLRMQGVVATTSEILKVTDYSEIPADSFREMTVFYLGIYLSAELAFLLLAIQEYIQSTLDRDGGGLRLDH